MSAYRTAAEPAEPPFEAEAYALAAPDDDVHSEPDEPGVPSVLMRAEDFVDPRTGRPGRSEGREMAIVILMIVALAAVLPVTVGLVWLGERFL